MLDQAKVPQGREGNQSRWRRLAKTQLVKESTKRASTATVRSTTITVIDLPKHTFVEQREVQP